ncbi:MAG: HAD-IA family hydrolase [Cellulomonadaceae bacterium]
MLAARPHPALDTVVLDLGQVLLGWDPAPAFTDVLPAGQVPDLLERIGFGAWNHAQDAGRSFAEGEAELTERFPEHAEAIRAYRRHFPRTLTGMVPGTAAVLAELKRAGVRVLALTNWSAETFPHAQERFGILDRFDGVLVSGAERLAKPDPAIFALACQRFGVAAERAVFVDDRPENVAGAERVGMSGIVFTDAGALRAELVSRGVLRPRAPISRPIYHLTERRLWRADADYRWSTRNQTHDAQGFVHCSFAEQVPGVRGLFYADLPDDDLVVLELDPTRSGTPVVVEDLGAGAAFPHLYGPLLAADVVAVHAPGAVG